MRPGGRLSQLRSPSAAWKAVITPGKPTSGNNTRSLSHGRNQRPPSWAGRRRAEGSAKGLAKDSSPTVFQQLFPDETTSPPIRKVKWYDDRGPPKLAPIVNDHLHKLKLPTLGKELDKSVAEAIHARFSRNPQSGPPAPDSQHDDAARGEEEKGAAVLMLTRASASLVESDFYRHAPQGKHIDGWSRGLTNVLQARDPDTQEPRGEYYLFFESLAAAQAYSDEIILLHQQARERMRTASAGGSDLAEPLLPSPPPGLLDDASEARLRSYALLPPTIQLDLKLFPLGRDVPGTKGLKTAFRLGLATSWAREAAQQQQHGHQGAGANGRETTTRPVSQSHKVLLSLYGAQMGLRALQRAIDDDGKERNLPWRLWKHAESIFPLGVRSGRWGWKVADERDDSLGSKVITTADDPARPAQRYSRFIVCFAKAPEARRFVRNWHRRSLIIAQDSNQDVEVEASYMW